jgi:hypothetical protein
MPAHRDDMERSADQARLIERGNSLRDRFTTGRCGADFSRTALRRARARCGGKPREYRESSVPGDMYSCRIDSGHDDEAATELMCDKSY